AGFWLEGGIGMDTGTGQASNPNNALTVAPSANQGMTFNRRSTLSLSGQWGEVRLGRDVLPQYWNLLAFDPFFNSGVGATQLFNGIPTGQMAARASNSIGYFLPANLGGFYGQVMYYVGENARATPQRDDGNGAGIRIGYASGPFNIAGATGRTRFVTGDARQSNLSASWDFGVAKLIGSVSRDEVGTLEGKGASLGVTAPIGVGEAKLNYSVYKTSVHASPESRKLSLGYVHNLSKRTAVYVSAAFLRNSNGGTSSVALGAGAPITANASSRGYDLGMRHTF
ncbi:MAG: porin, partial [Comamonadaceae bacterium]